MDSAISQLGKGTFSQRDRGARPDRPGGTSAGSSNGCACGCSSSRRRRNRFLRHMSHELKTPLANIREGTELLMDGAVGELDEAQREVTAILRDNGIKLQRLIENLLSFSAWQARHRPRDQRVPAAAAGQDRCWKPSS